MLSIHTVNLSSVDLNLLLVLEAALEERSVTRAAKRIGLSQPATSSALRRLRVILNDPLLVRSGRQMLLTARAEELLPTVASALHQIRTALEDKPAFNPAHGRTFTVVANDYAESILLPEVLKRIQTSAGSVRLSFIRADSLFQAPVEPLSSGDVDLAIGFAGGISLPSSLALEELWTEDNVVIARRRHPRIVGTINRKQFLVELHAAVFYHKLQTGLIDSILLQVGERRRLALTLPHFLGVCHAVANSDLIAIVPARLANSFAASLKLQVLSCPIRMPQFQFSILWHQRTRSDPAHIWLRSIVREAGNRINAQVGN